MTLADTRGASAPIGCGEWTAYIAGRGGSPIRFDVPYSQVSQGKVINAGGGASVSAPVSADAFATSCCEVFALTEPWRDELILYRGQELAHAGPVNNVTASQEGGGVQSSDLFAWMEQRFLEHDFHGDGDVAHIFRSIFDLAMEPDPSPNISISTRVTGVDAVRDFKGVEFRRAADVLRELARTGLDFTMDGRRLLAGGAEVFLSDDPLILHDEGCLSAEVSREGSTFATDVAVFGNTLEAGGIPVTGRATRASSVYGLVQRSYTELLISDNISADANALARLEAMQPAPLRVKAVLSQDAAFGYGDLICGRRVECRLQRAAGCIEVMGEMRLQAVDTDVSISDSGVSETVTITLIPIGVSEGA